jgi:hypothetical protein
MNESERRGTNAIVWLVAAVTGCHATACGRHCQPRPRSCLHTSSPRVTLLTPFQWGERKKREREMERVRTRMGRCLLTGGEEMVIGYPCLAPPRRERWAWAALGQGGFWRQLHPTHPVPLMNNLTAKKIMPMWLIPGAVEGVRFYIKKFTCKTICFLTNKCVYSTIKTLCAPVS